MLLIVGHEIIIVCINTDNKYSVRITGMDLANLTGDKEMCVLMYVNVSLHIYIFFLIFF